MSQEDSNNICSPITTNIFDCVIMFFYHFCPENQQIKTDECDSIREGAKEWINATQTK